MDDTMDYKPPKIWTWRPGNGGKFSNINRPTAGAQFSQELPIGKHPIQLYSLGTPNGVKVTVMLEELLELDHKGAEYDAWLIDIGKGDQFGSGFVSINPNSKIPALLDNSTNPPVSVFESGAILLYLAEKFEALIPKDLLKRANCLSWLFWQMGSTPYLGGGFGHFYTYAPKKFQYPIDRYTMEVKRQLHVLDLHLETNQFICGTDYTIADIANWPWYGGLAIFQQYDAADFLAINSYTNVVRWAEEIYERDAAKRGRMVNRLRGDLHEQLHERHDAGDFETKTQDKIGG